MYTLLIGNLLITSINTKKFRFILELVFSSNFYIGGLRYLGFLVYKSSLGLNYAFRSIASLIGSYPSS